MNQLLSNQLAKRTIIKTDLKILSFKDSFSILHDVKSGVWYFGILNKKLHPIKLFDNDIKVIQKVYNTYIFTGVILWEELIKERRYENLY